LVTGVQTCALPIYAGDAQRRPGAIVALHQHAHRVAVLGAGSPGGGADAALESVADHARPAAHASLRHGPAARAVQGGPSVRLGDMKAVDVVEAAIPRLRDDR